MMNINVTILTIFSFLEKTAVEDAGSVLYHKILHMSESKLLFIWNLIYGILIFSYLKLILSMYIKDNATLYIFKRYNYLY